MSRIHPLCKCAQFLQCGPCIKEHVELYAQLASCWPEWQLIVMPVHIVLLTSLSCNSAWQAPEPMARSILPITALKALCEGSAQ